MAKDTEVRKISIEDEIGMVVGRGEYPKHVSSCGRDELLFLILRQKRELERIRRAIYELIDFSGHWR